MSQGETTTTNSNRNPGRGVIVINLARCRYEVIRTAAESLGFTVDQDVEQLAQTLPKTIEQPQQTTSSTSNQNNNQQSQHQQQNSTTAGGGAAAAGASSGNITVAIPTAGAFRSTAAAAATIPRSNLSLLTVGNSHTRAPVYNDAVFAMLESRRAHIIWSDVTVSAQQLTSLACWQRLNHFPGISTTLSRKVPLGQTMMRAWKKAPEHFSYLVPLSFSIRRDNAVLRRYFEEIEYSKVAALRRKQQLKRRQAQAVRLQLQQQQDGSGGCGSAADVAGGGGGGGGYNADENAVPADAVASASLTNNPFLLFAPPTNYTTGAVDSSDSTNNASAQMINTTSQQQQQPQQQEPSSQQQQQPQQPPRPVFIFKPNSGCMGNGIRLTCKPLQLMQRLLTSAHGEDEDYVCQLYVDRPLLIDRRKFDLRVYVLLLGVTPELRVLVHREGLVRICASEYVSPKPSNVHKSTMHLTNYAVNRKQLKKIRNNTSGGGEEDDEDDEEEDDDTSVSEDQSEANQQEQRQQQQEEPQVTSISGIKKDFDFLNRRVLDTTFAGVGGSAEIWRRIDRSIVLTLMAGHKDLDSTYRKAATANQVLLRRSAKQYLKDRNERIQRQAALDREEEAEAAAAASASTSAERNVAAETVDEDDEEEEMTMLDENDDEEQMTSDDEVNFVNHDRNRSSNHNNNNNNDVHLAATTTSSSTVTNTTQKRKRLAPIADEEEFIQRCCIGRGCFELLGFDMLLTDAGHPFVMEVNHGPSLETGASIDMRIKSQVLRDVFRHVSVFLPEMTRKPHLRARRYLDRVVKRRHDADLHLPGSGFRVVHPTQDAQLAAEYRSAKAALEKGVPAAVRATPVPNRQQNQKENQNQNQSQQQQKVPAGKTAAAGGGAVSSSSSTLRRAHSFSALNATVTPAARPAVPKQQKFPTVLPPLNRSASHLFRQQQQQQRQEQENRSSSIASARSASTTGRRTTMRKRSQKRKAGGGGVVRRP